MEDIDECAICFAELSDDPDVGNRGFLPCGCNQFCKHCAEAQLNKPCPFCRTQLAAQPELMKGSAPTYAGETKCVAQYAKTKAPCKEWARYRATDGSKRLLCGVHSRKGKRADLPLNPLVDEQEYLSDFNINKRVCVEALFQSCDWLSRVPDMDVSRSGSGSIVEEATKGPQALTRGPGKPIRKPAGIDDSWSQGKNYWRHQAGSNGNVIELIAPTGQIAFIDAERHTEVAAHAWCASTPNEANTYFHSQVKIDGEWKTIKLYQFLFPDIEGSRDHINRNKLDNRKVNIRCGANGVNQRNQDRYGVTESNVKRAWIAQWTEFGAKTQSSKPFPWKDYETKDACEQAARSYYLLRKDRALADAIKHNETHGAAVPAQERRVRKVVTSNAREKNMSIDDKGTPHAILRVYVTINNKRLEKKLPMSHYATEEDAKISARAWLAKTKADNPKMPRRKRVKVVEMEESE